MMCTLDCNNFKQLRVSLLLFVVSLFVIVGCSNKKSDHANEEGGSVLPKLLFVQSSQMVDVYDFVEIKIILEKPTAKNPFSEVFVRGTFELLGQSNRWSVDGFCDSPDGETFRIRFMPVVVGKHTYTVTFWQNNLQQTYSGSFVAQKGKRRGVIGVDPEYPWHFVWKGTQEHYFLNGTTAFLLMGWEDEAVIRQIIDRLHFYKINRIRVLLHARTDDFWGEPVQPTKGFSDHVNPWVAKHPDSTSNPEFDFTRFNPSYWQKFERMLAYARDKEIIVSVVFEISTTKIHPPAWSREERGYFRYAVARLGAYSNVTWDLGDDLDGFRDDVWTHEAGMFLYDIDVYHHLATSHPMFNIHQDRMAPWFSMTSFQQWERPIHGWMLEQRRKQLASGRIIPQINEEYGYEDHYPPWAPYKAPSATADANRRAAWHIVMAGGYQTTGETAKRGTGVGPDSGGGWINGRGDNTMVMLQGYAHIVDFFTAMEWWKLNPHDELVNEGIFCLAELGRRYVIYLPKGGSASVTLKEGHYQAKWFNPRTGEYSIPIKVVGSKWSSPESFDGQDWVLSIQSSL